MPHYKQVQQKMKSSGINAALRTDMKKTGDQASMAAIACLILAMRLYA
jgi:hypothetical protein